jgi:hypothetical protein
MRRQLTTFVEHVVGSANLQPERREGVRASLNHSGGASGDSEHDVLSGNHVGGIELFGKLESVG